MIITGGKYNSIKIKFIDKKTVRPTLSKIRSGIFNSLSSRISFNCASFLDCFSGSGIMSIEALSRGFNKVISVEINPKTAKLINDNFSSVNETPNLFVCNVLKFLSTCNDKFDVIFIDPPYDEISLYENTLKLIFNNNLLSDNGVIVLETKKNCDINKFLLNFSIIKEKSYGNTTIFFLANKSIN